MPKKQWKVAVIGCGSFANGQYLPNITKETHAICVAAVDIVPERAQQACEKYGIPNWYSSVYELIEKCDFDIAIDAASIQAHHEINMAVIKAGKHLISQKPAAPTVELMTEQIEAAKAAGVKFACAPIHNMRYDLNFAKQLVEDGGIGNAYYAKCNSSHGGPEYFQYRDTDPSWFFDEGAGALVENDAGDGAESVAAQRGQTATGDLPEVGGCQAGAAQMDGQIAATGTHHQQNTEADELADNGGQSGTGNTQVKRKDQNGVEDHIQDTAGADTHHAVHGAALQAQLIVQRQ